MNKLIEFFGRRGLISDLLTIGVLAVGIMSVLLIRREVFPNVTFDLVTISTIYPGASAEETERLITNPLEQDLLEIDGIKKMTSASAEGRSYIVLQVDPDQATEAEVKTDVQEVVDRQTDLPQDAEDPVVASSESHIQPIVQVALSGKISEEKLRQDAKELEARLRRLPEVARVTYRGLRDLEIHVEAQPEKLDRYRVTFAELREALSQQNVSIPGGTMLPAGTDKEIILRTMGEFVEPEEIRKTVIRANALGRAIRVEDVATVEPGFEDANILYRVNGLPAIGLQVNKKEGGDAVTLVEAVRETVEGMRGQLSADLQVDYIDDLSFFIKRRLTVLSSNLFIGLALVLVVLSLLLPWRTALVTAVGIPFAFLVTMTYFHLNEISFNLISMLGLIIVIGMLVDDAIVVSENAQRKMDLGMSPEDAAIEGTKQIWAPVTASVFTTIMAFAPLMFISGIFGKFVSFIPIGVVVALLASLFECFFILPHHVAKWVKPHKGGPHEREVKGGGVLSAFWEKRIAPLYASIVRHSLRFRYPIVIATIAFVAFSLMFAKKHVPFILFPPGGVDRFIVNYETELGTPLEATFKVARPIEEGLATLPDEELESFATVAGEQPSNNDVVVRRGSEYGQVAVSLTPVTERSRTADEIMDEMREKIGQPPGIKSLTFRQIQGGPPVGMPVSIGVRGRDYDTIMKATNELKDYLSGVPGVSDLQDSFILGKEEIQLFIDQAEAKAAGLSATDIGQTVRAAYEGVVATSIKDLDEEIDVRITLDTGERNTREALKNLKVGNRQGNLVTLSRLVTFNEDRGISVYEHEGNERQVRVTSELDTEVTTSQDINEKVRAEVLPELQEKYPQLSFVFGGEDRDTQESLASLKRAFLLAVFGIYLILVLTFQSYLKPFLILTTIPLGVTGVVWTFFFHGRPLSFLAMMGVVALAGVIVNNAIVFVDFVNSYRKKSEDRYSSIVAAAVDRIRPIFLTTLTTVVGLLPTAYGIGGLDPFVVPIALALAWGIFLGSIMMTLIFPSIYSLLDDWMLLVDKVFKTRVMSSQFDSPSKASED